MKVRVVPSSVSQSSSAPASTACSFVNSSSRTSSSLTMFAVEVELLVDDEDLIIQTQSQRFTRLARAGKCRSIYCPSRNEL